MPNLELPPKKDDGRFDQWVYLLWKYLSGTLSPDNSSNIIEDRVFRQRDLPAGGVDVANSQIIEAVQAFSAHRSPYTALDVAGQQDILATQIFGG